MNRFSVLIVDDEPLAREGLRMLLTGDPQVVAISEAKNGREAVTAMRVSRPDLVFLDVQMPEMDGFDVVQEVGPERMPAVVFVTAHDQYAIRAFEINALDYLLKPIYRGAVPPIVGTGQSAFERWRGNGPSDGFDAGGDGQSVALHKAPGRPVGHENIVCSGGRYRVDPGGGELRRTALRRRVSPAAGHHEHDRSVT
jgi:CheY-like chemotaxis protein